MLKFEKPNISLDAVFQSGQTFSWTRQHDASYTGCVLGNAARVSMQDGDLVINSENESLDFWQNYFDLRRDYEAIIAVQNDDIILRAMHEFPGLRVLRQPVWETIITFILSANNNMTRIKNIYSAISQKYGTSRGWGTYSFPAPEVLAAATEEELRELKMGFRAPYIKKTAEMVRDGFPIDTLSGMEYVTALKKLCELPGVGEKVADCILLFSCGFDIAFPVDVWVKRLMKTHYLPEDIPVKQIKPAAVSMFGMHAGILQQFLFHAARNGII